MSDQGTIQFESDSQHLGILPHGLYVVSDQGTIQFESDSQHGPSRIRDKYRCV